MKIAFAVNDIATELPAYTTTRLAMAAAARGHDAWLIGMGDFAYDSDESVRARAYAAPKGNYKSTESFLSDLRGKKKRLDRVTLDDIDVLMLRNDPSTDTGDRSWAQSAGIDFGRLAMRRGVIVLNDPNGLAKALNKMYLQLYPEKIRPRTIITRDTAEIRSFAREEGGTIVLKPLQGSGGRGVFLLTQEMLPNLNQMVESISRDGYIIAQEYLKEAEEGDTRLFLMNGRPLRRQGKYAAFRRLRSGEDMRSNIHAGGQKAQALINDQILEIAEIVRPRLVQDGMFLVGLDIVGDKLMEINVFSPGGLGSARQFEKVNFALTTLDAIEVKVSYMKSYQRTFDNATLCTL